MGCHRLLRKQRVVVLKSTRGSCEGVVEIPGLRLAVEVLVADSASSRSSVGETHVSATCR